MLLMSYSPARSPPCSSIARNTNAYPVVVASTVRVLPRRPVYDFTSGSVISVGRTRVSAAMKAKRSEPTTGAALPDAIRDNIVDQCDRDIEAAFDESGQLKH